MLVFMFPGQGSQFTGMGKEWFEQSLIFGPLESRIDRIAGFSVRDMCLQSDAETLKCTEYAQPCLYIVNAIAHEIFTSQGKVPRYLAGHSLGEINALQAAGAFDLLDGLRIAVHRGRLMSEQSGGGMAAVLGLHADAVSSALQQAGLHDVDLANLNTPDQIVISGPSRSLMDAEEPLKRVGAGAVIHLPVSAAFHSRYMQPIIGAFDDFLKEIPFRPLNRPVISNVTARPYPSGDPEIVVRALLVRQITSPVRWEQTINYLAAGGATNFFEVGAGSILTRMLRSFDVGRMHAPPPASLTRGDRFQG